MELHVGYAPTSPAWKAGIITIILMKLLVGPGGNDPPSQPFQGYANPSQLETPLDVVRCHFPQTSHLYEYRILLSFYPREK